MTDLDEGRKRPQISCEANGSVPGEFRFHIRRAGLFLQPRYAAIAVGTHRRWYRRRPLQLRRAAALTDMFSRPCALSAPDTRHSMRTPGRFVVLPLLSALALSAFGCDRARGDAAPVNPIVGTWLVHDPNAPFPFHLYMFNGDGTMHQANPDAGNPRTSDSDGKGIWVARGDRVESKWVELSADRATRQYAGRLELTMQITVRGDSLTATETAQVFDATGAPAPAPATLKPLRGARVTLP